MGTMSRSTFENLITALGVGFAVLFAVIVVPPLIDDPDVLGAFGDGFVNPYSTGYSLDVFLCAAILFVWIFHERSHLGIRHGWVAVPLSFVPGVATGFAVYLVLRSRQLADRDVAPQS